MVFNGNSVPLPWAWTWHNPIVVIVGIICICCFLMVTFSRAHWHVGQMKRMLLGGTLIMFVAIALWLVEPNLPACQAVADGGKPLIFSLHPLWHIFCALGLNMWTCVCKYHRGEFYGYDVKVCISRTRARAQAGSS